MKLLLPLFDLLQGLRQGADDYCGAALAEAVDVVSFEL
jgi:hypothetical protein